LLLIERQLRQYAIPQLIQHVIDCCLHVGAASLGVQLYLL
jgi:hypothetical protein